MLLEWHKIPSLLHVNMSNTEEEEERMSLVGEWLSTFFLSLFLFALTSSDHRSKLIASSKYLMN
jgi:hypothetical protein